MKVKLTKMPVRIKDKRYSVGEILEVTDSCYKSIKSICMIVTPSNNKHKVKPKSDTEVVKNETESDTTYKKLTKDDIMIELAGKGIEFDPSLSKKELYEMLNK